MTELREREGRSFFLGVRRDGEGGVREGGVRDCADRTEGLSEYWTELIGLQLQSAKMRERDSGSD